MHMNRHALRVLVIEDDAQVRRVLRVALQHEGFQVLLESNGIGIHQVASAFQPDLAVLDVRLPTGPDGYAIARQLRSASNIPILFLTSARDLSARLAAFDAGADDYMFKPFAVPEFVARVNALLRRSGGLAPGSCRSRTSSSMRQPGPRYGRGCHSISPRRSSVCCPSWRPTPGRCCPGPSC